MNKIKVIIKQPGQNPKIKEIDNTLAAFQEVVGGYIEAVTVLEDVVVICNEEGRLIGLEENCSFFGFDFAGPIIVTKVDGDEFSGWDLSLEVTKSLFSPLWNI